MKHKSIIAVMLLAFIVGVFVGGYAIGKFIGKTLKDFVLANSSSDVCVAVTTLMRLRDNKIAESIELLETHLDSSLLSLQDYGEIPVQKQDKGIIGVLKLAKEYRIKYSRKTKHQAIDDAVRKALSLPAQNLN